MNKVVSGQVESEHRTGTKVISSQDSSGKVKIGQVK